MGFGHAFKSRGLLGLAFLITPPNHTMTSSIVTPGLLAHLNSAFDLLPLTHDVSISVISSHPRRTNGLYPNSSSAPKVWQEEVLVTVAVAVEKEEKLEESEAVGVKGHAVSPEENDPRLLVSALEAVIFTIPSTATTLIYISKADSTGYTSTTATTRQPPFTKTLLKSFISYHVSASTAPTPRVFVHLFARSQNQYLFPNSVEGGAKRVVGGAKLCAWWKSVFEEVAAKMKEKEVDESTSSPSQQNVTSDITKKPAELYLSYILPSYDVSEARGLVGRPKKDLPPGVEWQYLPPFHPTIPSPLNPEPSMSTQTLSIATLIPTFSDDPKARFITEILDEAVVDKSNRRSTRTPAFTEDSHDDSQSQPSAKRRRLGATSSLSEMKKAKKEDADEFRVEAGKMLEKVSYDEFWERMGFRQECASGDVTGFFGMGVLRGASFLPEASDKQEVGGEQLQDQVDEFQDNLASWRAAGGPSHQPQPKSFSVPPPVFARVMAALMNHDFGSRLLALNASEQFLTSIENIVDTELGTGRWKMECSIIAPHNTTSSAMIAPTPAKFAAPVNMLAVKKKKKPVA